VHWAWEAYRNDDSGKAEWPEPDANDNEAAKQAHAAQGPRPAGPYTTWIETGEGLQARDYDLSARNPNQDDRINLPHPAEITARLLESTRQLHSMIENIHAMLTNGEDE
jgi:hypothetical protein